MGTLFPLEKSFARHVRSERATLNGLTEGTVGAYDCSRELTGTCNFLKAITTIASPCTQEYPPPLAVGGAYMTARSNTIEKPDYGIRT